MSYRCAICQEALENDAVAAIKCGHTFHSHCISQWCERAKTCPSCRFSIKNFERDVFTNLFFDKLDVFSDLSTIVDEDGDSKIIQKLKRKCNAAESELAAAKYEINEKEKELDRVVKSGENLKGKINDLRHQMSLRDATAEILMRKYEAYDKYKEQNEHLGSKYEKLKKKFRTVGNINLFMTSPSEDAMQALDGLKNSSFEELKPFILNLKQANDDANKNYNKCVEKLRLTEKSLKEVNKENVELAILVEKLKQECRTKQTRRNETPFNRDLKSILAETPDTPQTAYTAPNSDSTPVVKKENLPKTKPALSLVYRNLNQKKPAAENNFNGDEILRESTRNAKKMRYDEFGGATRCSLFHEKMAATSWKTASNTATMKRSASTTNVVSDRKKPARVTKITDFPMKSNVSLDDSIECLE